MTTDLVPSLIEFYETLETWHDTRLTRSQIEDYFRVALAKNRILTAHLEGELVGYVESWRLTYTGVGKVVCGVQWDISKEDIETGPVCYVASVVVRPDHRHSPVIHSLKHLFFKQNFMCEYFIGEARRKKHQPLKVFRRQEFYDKYIAEDTNGKLQTIHIQ